MAVEAVPEAERVAVGDGRGLGCSSRGRRSKKEPVEGERI